MRRTLGAHVMAMAMGIVLAHAPAAHADIREEAATAYDRGAAAYDRGDFAVAARELARADELAPNPVALELAIAAAIRTDDAPLGLMLVERARERRGVKESVLREARRKLGAKAGKLDVRCPSPRCEVTVDGNRFEPNAPRYVVVGSHRVTLVRSSTPEHFDVVIEAGKTVELQVPAKEPADPAPAAAPAPPPSNAPPATVADKGAAAATTSAGGVAPVWFWIGLGATVLAGGATTLSAVDTRSKYDTFLRDRSDQAAADAGRAADQRTVIFLGATAVLAAGTALLGLVFVDWKKKDSGAALPSSKRGLFVAGP